MSVTFAAGARLGNSRAFTVAFWAGACKTERSLLYENLSHAFALRALFLFAVFGGACAAAVGAGGRARNGQAHVIAFCRLAERYF